MFAATAVVLAAIASVAVADPTPLEPSPGSVYREGANCTFTWTPDSTGVWTTMNVELMTGDNFNQVHLRTVASIDGTDAAVTSFSYPCLEVTPNAAIYFYKFSSPASPNILFTTRFTIADAEGATITPTGTQTITGGDVIQWGIGTLDDPTLVDEPPVTGSGSSNATTAAPTGATPTGGSNASGTRTRTGTTAASTSSTGASSGQTGAASRTLSLGSASAAILGAIGSALLF